MNGHPLRRKLRIFAYLAGGFLLLATALFLFFRRLDAQEIARWSRGATFIEVQGRRIRYELSPGPKDSPVLVYIPGWSAGSDAAKPVQGQLGVTTLSYDPCGVALSEARHGGCDGPQYADELHDILAKLAPNSKVVLLGHSYSGIIARDYLERYPEAVAGMILFEPNLPEYWAAAPSAYRYFEGLVGRYPRRLWLKAAFGVLRLERLIRREHPENDVARRVSDIHVNATHWRAVLSTRMAFLHSKPQQLVEGRWGNLPLLVVGTTAAENPLYHGFLAKLAKQSRRSELIEVIADHSHIVDDPKVGAQIRSRMREFLANIH